MGYVLNFTDHGLFSRRSSVLSGKTFRFTAAMRPHTQGCLMPNRIHTSGANIRPRQLIECIEDLQTLKAKMSPQPDKVLKHEFRRKYPSLRLRELDAAFAVVFDRRPGRPKKYPPNC
jgi:hypothetical protein